MRPRFHPRLINGPFDDPGLFIPFIFENRALLFDLGDISSLSPRDILKISHIFITHTHMDHFIGFDRLLRLLLGREKKLHLFGPQGFLKNAEGKLAGYSWNLVEKYNYRLRLMLTEIRSDCMISKSYHCRDKFVSHKEAAQAPFDGLLHEEPGFRICGTILDHGLPCLGFSLHERFHVNIIREELEKLGLQTGPWLSKFKQELYRQADPNSNFEVETTSGDKSKHFALGELKKQIARISPGQKITYISDVVHSESNAEKIIEFAKDSDQLFIEAVFLNKDHKMASNKLHLTARQAGELAAKAGVKQLTVFHFSPRYIGQEDLLYQEAAEAFERDPYHD
jgi:ribonuclease Z